MINICLDDIRQKINPIFEEIIQEIPNNDVIGKMTSEELAEWIKEWREKIKNASDNIDQVFTSLWQSVEVRVLSEVGLEIRMQEGQKTYGLYNRKG